MVGKPLGRDLEDWLFMETSVLRRLGADYFEKTYFGKTQLSTSIANHQSQAHATLNHNDIRPPSHACTPQRCTLYRPITMTYNPRTSTSCTTHSEHPYIALSPRSPCVLFSPCNTEAQRPHITIPCLNTSEMHILSTHEHTIRHPHPYTRPYTQSTLY